MGRWIVSRYRRKATAKRWGAGPRATAISCRRICRRRRSFRLITQPSPSNPPDFSHDPRPTCATGFLNLWEIKNHDGAWHMRTGRWWRTSWRRSAAWMDSAWRTGRLDAVRSEQAAEMKRGKARPRRSSWLWRSHRLSHSIQGAKSVDFLHVGVISRVFELSNCRTMTSLPQVC